MTRRAVTYRTYPSAPQVDDVLIWTGREYTLAPKGNLNLGMPIRAPVTGSSNTPIPCDENCVQPLLIQNSDTTIYLHNFDIYESKNILINIKSHPDGTADETRTLTWRAGPNSRDYVSIPAARWATGEILDEFTVKAGYSVMVSVMTLRDTVNANNIQLSFMVNPLP